MIARPLLRKEEFDIAVQGALIALHSHNAVPAPVDDSAGDGAMTPHGVMGWVTPHGVNGDEGCKGSCNVQHIETSGNGGDGVGRAAHLALAGWRPAAKAPIM